MANLELIVLGSASGMPEPDRAHACLALHRPGEIWLLDAGEGACSAMLRAKLDPQEIKGIFITHCHPDHCVGLFMVLQYLHMRGWRQQLPIYLPAGAIAAFQRFLDQLYLIRGEINPDYHLHPLRAKHVLGDDLTLQSFPTKHLQRWKELALANLEVESYAFRVMTPGKSALYSGDIADFSDIAALLRSGELLILEGAHIEIKAMLRSTVEAGIFRIILTHILPDAPWQWEEIQVLADKFGQDITRARDGLKVAL